MPTPQEALALALRWLREQADGGFTGTVHAMTFPRWAGFVGGPERQASDQFARAVLADVLLDLADGLDRQPAEQAHWRAVASQEAERLAAARLPSRRGGWSYFPQLPQLPPDLDSLAAAMRLFARAAPRHLALTEVPCAIALTQRGADGSCPTWLIADDDAPQERDAMLGAVQRWWGGGVDVDVNLRFALALRRAGRSQAEREPSEHFVRSAQDAAGAWPPTWYWSPLSTIELALQIPGVRTEPARDLVRSLQHEDGGWGVDDSAALDTALGVTLLAGHDDAAMQAGVRWLCDNQSLRGSWRASPWIRMDVGRAQGRTAYSARHGCQTLSTAYAARALLQAGPCL